MIDTSFPALCRTSQEGSARNQTNVLERAHDQPEHLAVDLDHLVAGEVVGGGDDDVVHGGRAYQAYSRRGWSIPSYTSSSARVCRPRRPGCSRSVPAAASWPASSPAPATPSSPSTRAAGTASSRSRCRTSPSRL